MGHSIILSCLLVGMVPTPNSSHRFDDVLILTANLNLIENLLPVPKLVIKPKRERETKNQIPPSFSLSPSQKKKKKNTTNQNTRYAAIVL